MFPKTTENLEIAMEYQSEHVVNLANSIIGVSILAMPYCFKECGIILSILLLFISSIISRLSCHFLLRSAIISRRKTFEYLAFHAFGPLGKFIIEIGIIGFMLGTCIAFFVVMGDLGPEIISAVTGSNKSNTMRTSVLMALALFCVLPLGLLRKVDSLAGVSKATIAFYCCLVLKIVAESAPHVFSGEWQGKVELWRPAGILQCIPIFSMALFCQTQLFEIYQAMPNASLEKMNEIIRVATNICTFVYIFVGMFGYIAFYQSCFGGNILLSFRPSAMADAMKLGFVLSLAFSFPLVIFPCRASLYSLIYKRAYSVHEGSASNYIPEGKFKSLTFIIVFFSLLIAVLIPSIELVLGLIGSTIGVMICVVFPVTCFICVSQKYTNERLIAQLLLSVGILVMVLGTYANLYAIEEIHINPTEITEAIPKENLILSNENKMEIQKVVTAANVLQNVDKKPPDVKETAKEVRHEPPQPEEPQESVVSAKNLVGNEVKAEKVEPKVEETHEKQGPVVEPVLPEENKPKSDAEQKSVEPKVAGDAEKKDAVPVVVEKQKKTEEVDIEAIKKEETELKEQEKSKEDVLKKQLDILQQQNEVQKQIVEQQKQILEVIKQHQEHASEKEDLEKVKQKKLEAVKQIETIAKQAIESLGGKEEQKSESKPVESEKKQEASSVKLVPLPIAVSNNLTIDGKPRQQTKEKENKPTETVVKENEFNINKVDNMNINIKHEINVNVDNGPKNLVELLNGKKGGKNSSAEHARSERSVKNEAISTKSEFVLSKSDAPLAEIVSKLSEANLAALKDINVGDVKTPGRDLKSFQAKI